MVQSKSYSELFQRHGGSVCSMYFLDDQSCRFCVSIPFVRVLWNTHWSGLSVWRLAPRVPPTSKQVPCWCHLRPEVDIRILSLSLGARHSCGCWLLGVTVLGVGSFRWNIFEIQTSWYSARLELMNMKTLGWFPCWTFEQSERLVLSFG